MACAEFEDLILDYCEGEATPADRIRVEQHTAGCADCRVFLVEQQELELRLLGSILQPSLPPAFDTHLAARIAAQRQPVRFRRVSRVLDGIGYLSLAIGAGCLLEQLPHSGAWIALVTLGGSAVFGVWESAKALRGNFGHR